MYLKKIDKYNPTIEKLKSAKGETKNVKRIISEDRLQNDLLIRE